MERPTFEKSLYDMTADVQVLQSANNLNLYGTTVSSRLLLGSAGYPSPEVVAAAVRTSGTEVVTASVRRETAGGRAGNAFLDLIANLGTRVLPNTAGCRSAREAVTTARMAREIFATSWIKLEVIANDDTLQPDVVATVEAATELVADGFDVFPYTTDDLSVAERLQRAGCQVIMPWASPIGSGQGLVQPRTLKSLRAYFPDAVLIIDAGIGAPSHAAAAMELGYDAVLLNSAVARAGDPVRMAGAFAQAVVAGRIAHHAGLMPQRDMAVPSTPLAGTPFFDIGRGSS